MTKIDAFQLRKSIPTEEFDYNLLTSALSSYSGVRQKINELIKADVITRVKKGFILLVQNIILLLSARKYWPTLYMDHHAFQWNTLYHIMD